jgi:AcrR family transcriptional regulator
VQKTRKLLQDALVELISEKSFDAVKIQDILDKANVGRSTFYAHYQDKGELLHSCFEEVQKILEQHTAGLSSGFRKAPDFEYDFDFTLKFFKFAERNSRLIKAMLKHPGLTGQFVDSLVDLSNGPIRTHLAQEKNSDIPSEIIIHYFISAFLGTLKWWVSKDMPCTAEEADGYFKQLAQPTMRSLLKGL